jgi:hypothetical protein
MKREKTGADSAVTTAPQSPVRIIPPMPTRRNAELGLLCFATLQYRLAASDIYARMRGGRDQWQLPPAPVTAPTHEAVAIAEYPHG